MLFFTVDMDILEWSKREESVYTKSYNDKDLIRFVKFPLCCLYVKLVILRYYCSPSGYHVRETFFQAQCFIEKKCFYERITK